MDYVPSLVWNQNFQSLVLSPLIGALMGFALSYIFTPLPGRRTAANIPYIQVVDGFNIAVHHHYHSARSSEDQAAFLIGIALTAGSAWLYLEHGLVVLSAITFFAAFVFVASVAFIVQQLLAEGGKGWLVRPIWPAVASAVAATLTRQAREVVDYMIETKMTFQYFLSIKGTNLFWIILFQTMGMMFVAAAVYFSAVATVYQIALGSLPDPQDIFSFRGWIVRKAQRIGGAIGFLVCFLFLGLAWFCLSGTALRLF